MTESVILFADKWNISPFEVLEKDIDDFILIINSFINKAEAGETEYKKSASPAKKKDDFWDF